NADDAITAQHLNGADTVAINTQPVVTFSGYDVLNINGQGGTDTFAVSPQGMTVTLITVNGFNPNAQGKLIVNGTSAEDDITFTPTAAAAGSVAIVGLPTVDFTNVAGVAINGQGGGDTLSVEGTQSNDRFIVAPGSAVDAGSVQVNTLVPLAY